MITLPFPDITGLSRVGAAVILVIVAIIISRWRDAGLEKDLMVATVRSFVQLLAIGYALEFIFGLDNPVWTTMLLGFMMVVAGRTAGGRGKKVPNARWVAFAAIAGGSGLTLGTLLLLNIFTYDPQTIIPIGGMVIGNAMTVAALVMSRLSNDFQTQSNEIEQALALGAPSQVAARPQLRQALQNALIPITDTTKTVGLIKLPGAMTGMILAGASPMEAVQLQMIVMYMLVGASAFTGLLAAWLTYRGYFTPAHQLQMPA